MVGNIVLYCHKMSEDIQEPAERTRVGFPEAPAEEPRSFNYKALIVVILVLALIGGGMWYLLFSGSGEEEMIAEETPTPMVEEVTSTPVPTEAQTVNKADVTIQVLNGSGIAGSAGKAQSALKALGYTQIEVGNADSYTYKTTVAAFDDKLSAATKTEITAELEKIYGKIDVKPNTSTKYSVIITIGYPKGFTPSPTGRPTSATTTTPTTRPTTGTVTPTLSVTVTPTP